MGARCSRLASAEECIAEQEAVQAQGMVPGYRVMQPWRNHAFSWYMWKLYLWLVK
jgi:hypothetical protein